MAAIGDGDEVVAGFKNGPQADGIGIGNDLVVGAVEDGDGDLKSAEVFVSGQAVMQYQANRVNGCIMFHQRGHAVIGCFQNELMGGLGGGQLGGNTRSHGFAVECDAVGPEAGGRHLINQQRVFIQCSLGEFAGAFAKARIIGHPNLVTQTGEMRCKAGIPTDVFPVAVKIQHHTARGAGCAFELDDIKVAVLGKVDGGVQVRLFEFVIMLPAQGNGVQENNILNKIKRNTAGHIDAGEDNQPADQSFFQFDWFLALQRLVFYGKKEPRQPGRGSQWNCIWKKAFNDGFTGTGGSGGYSGRWKYDRPFA